MNHYYSKIQNAIKILEKVEQLNLSFKQYNIDDQQIMTEYVTIAAGINDHLVSALMIRYGLASLKMPLLQTKDWKLVSRRLSYWIDTKNNIVYLDKWWREMIKEFKEIEDNADCMAFKLRWS